MLDAEKKTTKRQVTKQFRRPQTIFPIRNSNGVVGPAMISKRHLSLAAMWKENLLNRAWVWSWLNTFVVEHTLTVTSKRVSSPIKQFKPSEVKLLEDQKVHRYDLITGKNAKVSSFRGELYLKYRWRIKNFIFRCWKEVNC